MPNDFDPHDFDPHDHTNSDVEVPSTWMNDAASGGSIISDPVHVRSSSLYYGPSVFYEDEDGNEQRRDRAPTASIRCLEPTCDFAFEGSPEDAAAAWNDHLP